MLAALPMAVAIALSPFAIIPAIVLLLTPRPRAAASAFLAGWWLGVALVAGLAVAIVDASHGADAPARWRAWAGLLLGGALLVLGAMRWRARGRGATPAWLQGVQSATPRHALLLGLTLSAANPKVLLLAVAGGVAIGAGDMGPLRQASGVFGFALASSLSVALPLSAFMIAPGKAMPLLARLREWLEANADAVMAAVFLALGAALVLKAFGSL
ncbi:MAG: GAP family protein [Xanthomonadales bacterium]|nr:GAP family protein [Xanthomonadales bacterium]